MESGGRAPRIRNLGSIWRWVVSFTPQPLYPRERAPGTHRIGGWVDPRSYLDAVTKRKKSLHFPFQKSNPCRLAHCLVSTLTELPAPHWFKNRTGLIFVILVMSYFRTSSVANLWMMNTSFHLCTTCLLGLYTSINGTPMRVCLGLYLTTLSQLHSLNLICNKWKGKQICEVNF
jgi:hypothetical protein